MKKKINVLLAMTYLVVICSWTYHSQHIKTAEWLIGTWENKTQRGSLYETWVKVSDDELKGKSYMLKETDTIVFETTRLIQENDRLVYIPVVKDQNNGLPVRFPSKLISEDKLVFENPEHDFPQTISYTRVGPDSLVAEISGKKNGQQRRQTYPMKRLK